MTYSSVHNFFEHNELPQSNGDWDTDFSDAVDAMISISEEPIEFFDIHDLIDAIERHYGIDRHDLLEEYDRYQQRRAYSRR